jgi:hypothetical protein
MAVQLAGTARYRSRSSHTRRRVLVVVVALVILAITAGIFILPGMRKKVLPAHTAQQQPSFAARQTMDISLVAGAVGQYAAANGVLPAHLSAAPDGDLVLCGDVCNPTLYGVGGFGAYQASNIKLMAYTTGLTTPGQSVMYLVPGAKCGADGRAGDPNPTPRSMVILFAVATGSGTPAPRCVVL